MNEDQEDENDDEKSVGRSNRPLRGGRRGGKLNCSMSKVGIFVSLLFFQI